MHFTLFATQITSCKEPSTVRTGYESLGRLQPTIPKDWKMVCVCFSGFTVGTIDIYTYICLWSVHSHLSCASGARNFPPAVFWQVPPPTCSLFIMVTTALWVTSQLSNHRLTRRQEAGLVEIRVGVGEGISRLERWIYSNTPVTVMAERRAFAQKISR